MLNNKCKQNIRVIYFGSIFVFVLFLTLYSWFSVPSLFWEDSSQMETVIRTCSITHTPGHPLYVILGRGIFLFLDIFINPSKACVLVSVILFASALSLFYLLSIEMSGDWRLSMLVTAWLGLSPGIFHYATITETYSLLLIGLSWIMLLYSRSIKLNLLCFYLIGLFCGGNIIILGLLPWGLLYLWLKHRDLKIILVSLGLFIAGSSVYFFILFRSMANPPLDWGNPENFTNFISMITMTEFRSDFTSGFLATGNILTETWKIMYQLIVYMLFVAIIPLILGMRRLWKEDKHYFFIVTGLWISYLIFAIRGGKGPDFQAYLIPLYFFIALFLLFFKAKIKYYLPFFALIIVIDFIFFHPPFQRKNSRGAENYQQKFIQAIPSHSLVICDNTNEYFLILHHQIVNQHRKDIIPVYTDLLDQPWYLEQLNSRLTNRQIQSLADYHLSSVPLPIVYIPAETWNFNPDLFIPGTGFFIKENKSFNYSPQRLIDDPEPTSQNHQRVIWENEMNYLFNRQHWTFCLKALDSLTLNFVNWEYYYNQAVVLSELADSYPAADFLHQGLSQLDKSEQAGGDHQVIDITRSRILIKLNRFSEALECLQNVPETVQSVKLKIIALYFSGQTELARLLLRKALLKWPDNTELEELKLWLNQS
ncbi:MAG: hypothetical protein ACP5FK_03065 [bacterium]